MVVCNFCKKKILKGSRRVHYTEDINDKIDFDISFHAKCWVNKYNFSLDEKVKAYANKMMSNVMPKIKHELQMRGMAP